ncbi:MAG: type III-A CRISPR-associated protein Csm2 [Bacteroidota bacterium]
MNTPTIKSGFHCVKAFKPEWITKKIDRDGIDYLENLGFFLCDKRSVEDRRPGRNGVTTSQMRNLFSEIKRIELKLDDTEDWETDFLLLRPKIAYNAARVLAKDSRSRMDKLKTVLEMAHRAVATKSHFKNFSKFMEGIIAYHNVYGGKD